MDAEQKLRLEKIERYFRNSSRFIWGLGGSNKKEAYKWLKGKGYEFNDKTEPYPYVTSQLLGKLGIEKIIEDLVIPGVEERFSSGALAAFRQCWYTGTLPRISFLHDYNISDAYPFLEVNSQYKYVERWGEFAGVWIEEIESYRQSRTAHD